MNTRSQAAKIINQVIEEHKGLNEINLPNDPFVKHLCYGVIRNYESLRNIAQKILHTEIAQKDKIIFYIIIVTLYQIIYTDTPDYAACNEGVTACADVNKSWAQSLVNKISHVAIKDKEKLLAACTEQLNSKYNHPFWLIKKIKRAWPEHWEEILRNNLIPAPMDLRVNLTKISRDDFLIKLKAAKIIAAAIPNTKAGIRLQNAKNVDEIPGFSTGEFSVQDLSGQLAIELLPISENMSVLDACAAPGSKSCHLLERMHNKLNLTAIDKSSKRLALLQQNLQRNSLTANVKAISAVEFASNCLNKYDLILLDAPCSAIGVVRRHPEIKLLRNKEQIDELITVQKELLDTLWKLVAPGGAMLYTTCSILPEENFVQITDFLSRHHNAKLKEYQIPDAIMTYAGSQLLPSADHDGFFYAYLQNRS
jgi:16S rRNA (cytosine967-C5)-methyltransferase